jgi:hypothetical protein
MQLNFAIDPMEFSLISMLEIRGIEVHEVDLWHGTLTINFTLGHYVGLIDFYNICSDTGWVSQKFTLTCEEGSSLTRIAELRVATDA